MNGKIVGVIFLLVGMLAASAMVASDEAAVPIYPALPETADSLVLDFAGIVGTDERQRMDADIEGLFGDTGATLAVVTVDTFHGIDEETYAMTLFNGWGIGDPARNDGILLILAAADRSVYLMPGAGIAHLFTEAAAGTLLDDYFIETFYATGDIASALACTVEAIRAWYTSLYQTEGIVYQQM